MRRLERVRGRKRGLGRNRRVPVALLTRKRLMPRKHDAMRDHLSDDSCHGKVFGTSKAWLVE